MFCFIKWIHNNAKAADCEHLFFLTREGAFVRELYNIAYKENAIDNETLYASRRSLMAASSDLNWELMYRIFGSKTVEYVLEIFKIPKTCVHHSVLKRKFSEWECDEEIKRYLYDYSTQQRTRLLKMLQMDISTSNSAIIDVGWKGTSQYLFDRILKNAGYNGKLIGLYFGEFYDDFCKNLLKHGYLCSSKDKKYKESVLNAGFIFENTLTVPYGTTTGYQEIDGNIKPIFDDNSAIVNDGVSNGCSITNF